MSYYGKNDYVSSYTISYSNNGVTWTKVKENGIDKVRERANFHKSLALLRKNVRKI